MCLLETTQSAAASLESFPSKHKWPQASPEQPKVWSACSRRCSKSVWRRMPHLGRWGLFVWQFPPCAKQDAASGRTRGTKQSVSHVTARIESLENKPKFKHRAPESSSSLCFSRSYAFPVLAKLLITITSRLWFCGFKPLWLSLLVLRVVLPGPSQIHPRS